ncbi:MAG: zinc metalloprotease [Candidatus Dojkabacteria bacterium]|nr:MAG: zinc metalloprotease [Candidatus Dojkabacteria bacterium]
MTFFITTTITLLIISFLVFIHEFGHFAAARLTGVKVKEFSIGFGKSIFQFVKGETKYKIGIVPLGGYVQLEGEQSDTGPDSFRSKPYLSKFFILVAGVLMNLLFAVVFFAISLSSSNYRFVVPKFGDFQFSNVEKVIDAYPVTFADISPNSPIAAYWDQDELTIISINNQRFENYQQFKDLFDQNIGKIVQVEAIDLENFEIQNLELVLGDNQSPQVSNVYIVDVDETSPLKNLIYPGDQVISINGIVPNSPDEFNKIIDQNEGKEINLKILRNGQEVEIKFTPILQDKININGEEFKIYLKALLAQYEYGYAVIYDSETNRSAYFIQYKPSILSGVFMVYDLTRYQFVALANIFTTAQQTGDLTEISNSFGGVAQVGDQVGQVVELQAFSFLVPLAGLISLALATFNILPFPALDGGQVVVITIESLIRRPIPDRVLSIINTAGFIVLIIFGILVTIKDVIQLGWINF